ncbi:hypothetical protein C499_10834 [Halogeometricum borinquense DSM 11551]|uniref:Uncharacterized protein n=1 Tax=Halogeometricum borinquense (strain ATCC 700274 / DSM 11551 / JCM 10706 / KCTC 4070 / PR3) TaxID=469382 RepID=E4NRL9_HALBP|nr:hypothetical protein [Halogeometricum borinquense]ADQ65695.1 hypothetical protein Hbor_00820 [Halogeometricum borinquense DSM 11551]ELY27025.1 hypothetical protein C499_10834 [Halogeometricum borinquense DSM 11551]
MTLEQSRSEECASRAVEEESNEPVSAPRVDAAECAAAFLIPILVAAVWMLAAGAGLKVLLGGGTVGWMIVRVRLRFRAVRTADGIKRQRCPTDEGWGMQFADWEYDPKWDRRLAAVLAVIGAGAFVAIPVVDAPDGILLRLVVIGHVSLICALAVFGVAQRD